MKYFAIHKAVCQIPHTRLVDKQSSQFELWLVLESPALNKRIWITKEFGELRITSAQLDLNVNSKEYADSHIRHKFKNISEMAQFIKSNFTKGQ